MEGCGCPDDVCEFAKYIEAFMAAKEEGKPVPQVIVPGSIESEEKVMEE